MKALDGSASASVAADESHCLRFLADLEAYPRWYPEVVRSVTVLERDGEGRPTRARSQLRAAVGPIARDVDLVLLVTHAAHAVTLSRELHEPADPERFEVAWTTSASPGAGTSLRLRLEASLDVPRFVPLSGVGDAMAGGFVTAAARALGG